MPLSPMQKAIIDATIEYGVDDLLEHKDKPQALRAFQLMLKENALSLEEGAALSEWFIDEDQKESLLGSVGIVQSMMMHNYPQLEGGFNLVRYDDLSGDSYPKVSAREVKDYIAGVVNGRINELQEQGIEAAQIPSLSIKEKRKIILEAAKKYLQDIETYKSGAKKIFKSAATLWVLQKLIKEGAKTVVVNSADKEIIERIVKILGAVEEDKWKENLFYWSIIKGNNDLTRPLLEVLIDAGLDVNYRDKRGNRYLDYAFSAQNVEMIKTLLKSGASVANVNTNDVRSIIVDVIKKNNVEMAKALVDAGVDIGVKGEFGTNCLWHAVSYGKVELLKVLVDAGADVRVKDYAGRTLLQEAAINDDVKMVKLLAEYGVDVNHQGRFKGTALHELDKFNSVDMFKTLVELGADVNEEGIYLRSPLYLAVLRGDIKSAESLVDVGADISLVNRDGLNSKDLDLLSNLEKRQEDKKNKAKDQDQEVLPDSFVDDLLKDDKFVEGMNRVEYNVEGILGEGVARSKNLDGLAVDSKDFSVAPPDLTSAISEVTGSIQDSRVQEIPSKISGGSKDMVQFNPQDKITKEVSAADQLALGKVAANLAKSFTSTRGVPKGVVASKKHSSRGH